MHSVSRSRKPAPRWRRPVFNRPNGQGKKMYNENRPTCRDCSQVHGWCRKCGEVLRCNDHSDIPHEREDLTGQCMGHTPKRIREREYRAHDRMTKKSSGASL